MFVAVVVVELYQCHIHYIINYPYVSCMYIQLTIKVKGLPF